MNRKATTYTLREIGDLSVEANFYLTKQSDNFENYAISFAEDGEDVGIFEKVAEDTFVFRWYKP